MCGIAGFIDISNRHPDQMIKRMTNTIIHRGPDDEGFWCDINSGVALGHRRLSIVDISPAGHQPMHSASGRFVITFNGEIYNYRDLQTELEKNKLAPNWRGHSDTEVLLAGFDAWGIEKTIKRSIGMFAFAVWDKQERSLTLGRDRIGEKPLYYGWQNNVFMFASELKALRIHPSFNGDLDRDSLCLFLRHNCIPAPYSIYNGINKLLAGCLLKVSLCQQEPIISHYWSVAETALTGQACQFNGNSNEAVNELENLLKDAIHKQMTGSDVPIGAFLSGGIDSSIIVALMQAQSACPVKTFSIGFYEDAYNEAKHAK
ncbi:MAG: asparagine synthase (glutamine-hydrolyzing), partial [Deltaproteobacteria bacterium]